MVISSSVEDEIHFFVTLYFYNVPGQWAIKGQEIKLRKDRALAMIANVHLGPYSQKGLSQSLGFLNVQYKSIEFKPKLCLSPL